MCKIQIFEYENFVIIAKVRFSYVESIIFISLKLCINRIYYSKLSFNISRSTKNSHTIDRIQCRVFRILKRIKIRGCCCSIRNKFATLQLRPPTKSRLVRLGQRSTNPGGPGRSGTGIRNSHYIAAISLLTPDTPRCALTDRG